MEVFPSCELLEIKSKENEKLIWSIKNFDQTLESQHDKKKVKIVFKTKPQTHLSFIYLFTIRTVQDNII